ncbi:MAG: hypothetical protein OXG09_00720 [Chloroflexi bacterium]|nr:hypothetical protein [Chloroflexota bacterium]
MSPETESKAAESAETPESADAAEALSPTLLELLRCPVAVHYEDRGEDPGRLQLVRVGHWLHCPDSGHNYPIRDGIPVMLVEEGERWRGVPLADLPIPPPE